MNAGQEKGSDPDGGILPCLIVNDHKAGRYRANIVPGKGTDLFVKAILIETGYRELVLKSDNEPAILTLKGTVRSKAK